MPDYPYKYLKKAHRQSYGNLKQVKASKVCGCFCCTKVFAVTTFPDGWLPEEQSDREKTVQCPFCGIDAVLEDASGFPVTDAAFLQVMNKIWFGGYIG